MHVQIHTVTIEATNPRQLAEFWRALLGYAIEPNFTDSVQIGDPSGKGPRMLFAPSPRDKASTNRIHFDLRPDDQLETIVQAVALGATLLAANSPETSWTRMRDPEGNEFCVLQSQSSYDAFVAAKPTSLTFMNEGTCVFCELIRTGDAEWVAKDGDTVAFRGLPDSELAPGHTLVVPREHVVGLLGASPQQLASVMELAQRVAIGMRDALGATGTVILQASGPDAGGSVPHLHVHVVPCWADDGVIHWPESTSAHLVEGEPHKLIAAAIRLA